jgi:hypothetical protein
MGQILAIVAAVVFVVALCVGPSGLLSELADFFGRKPWRDD